MVAIAGPVDDAAAQAPAVRVTIGSRAVSLSAQQVRASADVPPTAYTLRDPGGTQVVKLSGLSLPGLVRLAGGNPATVRELMLPRARAGFVRLSGADLAEPTPFADGPPLVFVDGSSLRFFRPVRGPTDSNAADNIATQPGDALSVTVFAGAPLAVRASADPPRARAGQRIAFSASAAAGGELAFEWRFDDGTTARGATVRHAFAGPGRYRVVVTAAGADGSGGTSEPVEVAVGRAPGAAGEGRGRGDDPGQGAGGSPGASGRDAPGTGRAPAARDSQPTSGAARTGASPSEPAQPAATPQAPAQSRMPSRRRSRTVHEPAGERRVEGIVLRSTDVALQTAATQPVTRLGAREGSGGAPTPLAVVALALIAAGALLESRLRAPTVAR